MNYFLIRLPLTYINAVEALSYYKLLSNQCVLVIFYQDRNDVDTRHINKILDKSLWRDIVYLPYNVKSSYEHDSNISNLKTVINRFVRIRRFVNILNRSVPESGNAERVFLGDYNIASMRHIVNKLKPDQVVLLDEGFKVFQTIDQADRENQKSFFAKILSYNFVKGLLSSLIFGYKIGSIEQKIFFTSWDVSAKCNNVEIIKNNYSYLKSKIDTSKKLKGIFFLGQSFSEIKIKMMNFETYFNYLVEIRDMFRDQVIYYVPHRGESKENVDYYVKKLGFELLFFDIPIEYQLATHGPIPERLVSFCSSSLVNCNIILGDLCKITSIYIYPEDLAFVKRDYVSKYYRYLESLHSEMFTVIKIPKKCSIYSS